jgi:hypothetical protein
MGVTILKKLPTRANVITHFQGGQLVLPFELMQTLLGQVKMDVYDAHDVTLTMCLAELLEHCVSVTNMGNRALRGGITTFEAVDDSNMMVTSSAGVLNVSTNISSSPVANWENPMYGQIKLDGSFSIPRGEFVALVSRNSVLEVTIETLSFKTGEQLGMVKLQSGATVLECVKDEHGQDVDACVDVSGGKKVTVVPRMAFPCHALYTFCNALPSNTRCVVGIAHEAGLMANYTLVGGCKVSGLVSVD